MQIVLPPHLDNVRDKLAENIHELWGMNKIELGWTYGKVDLPTMILLTHSLHHYLVLLRYLAAVHLLIPPKIIILASTAIRHLYCTVSPDFITVTVLRGCFHSQFSFQPCTGHIAWLI